MTTFGIVRSNNGNWCIRRRTLDPLLEPLGDAARHRLHVPPGTEAAPGAGDDDRPDTGIAAQTL